MRPAVGRWVPDLPPRSPKLAGAGDDVVQLGLGVAAAVGEGAGQVLPVLGVQAIVFAGDKHFEPGTVRISPRQLRPSPSASGHRTTPRHPHDRTFGPQLCLLEEAHGWAYEHKRPLRVCEESLSDFSRRRVFISELDMTESQKLLAQYAANGSEEAFRELVARFINLVYSTALRLVDGETHRAQVVAQEVFMDLARLARGLSSKVMLGGGLPRHTCFIAAKTLRGERRRQDRERQATEMNALEDHAPARFEHLAPILDEAINQLSTPDRTAI